MPENVFRARRNTFSGPHSIKYWSTHVALLANPLHIPPFQKWYLVKCHNQGYIVCTEQSDTLFSLLLDSLFSVNYQDSSVCQGATCSPHPGDVMIYILIPFHSVKYCIARSTSQRSTHSPHLENAA